MGAPTSSTATLLPTSKIDKPAALRPSLGQEITDAVSANNGELPYWQVNVPADQRKADCPVFLKDITDRNRDIIRVPFNEYRYQTWEEVKALIDSDAIDRFRRAPTDHRKYLAYMDFIKNAYGSIMNFVQQRRLKWSDLTPVGAPFTNPDDIKIIYNDWPYGIDPQIVHLCVWTKFELLDDQKTERLTPQAKREIDEYVDKTFRSRVPRDQVRWFKNWANLKSIHSMEHFHVLLFNPDPDFIKEITSDDIPLSRLL